MKSFGHLGLVYTVIVCAKLHSVGVQGEAAGGNVKPAEFPRALVSVEKANHESKSKELFSLHTI